MRDNIKYTGWMHEVGSNLFTAYFMLVSCLTLKMEVTYSSRTSDDFHQATGCYVLEKRVLGGGRLPTGLETIPLKEVQISFTPLVTTKIRWSINKISKFAVCMVHRNYFVVKFHWLSLTGGNHFEFLVHRTCFSILIFTGKWSVS
jgi:hypothetical protein